MSFFKSVLCLFIDYRISKKKAYKVNIYNIKTSKNVAVNYFTHLINNCMSKNLFKAKGCVRYSFASLFSMSKREHSWKKEKIFYFTSKALFVIEIIKFKLFSYSNAMTSSNAQAWNTKHILLNNLGSKQILVMKFGQFM